MRILFVCSGNVCRSPFAEACLRRDLAEAGVRGLAVTSAGTLGLRDRPPTREMIATGREHGLDLSVHRSRPLHRGTLHRADLVVVMERDHQRHIEDLWPEQAGKIHLLREFESEDGAGPREDVFDPIGLPLEQYRRCADLMARCVRNLSLRLRAGR